jgi:hypothetical protein
LQKPGLILQVGAGQRMIRKPTLGKVQAQPKAFRFLLEVRLELGQGLRGAAAVRHHRQAARGSGIRQGIQ